MTLEEKLKNMVEDAEAKRQHHARMMEKCDGAAQVLRQLLRDLAHVQEQESKPPTGDGL